MANVAIRKCLFVLLAFLLAFSGLEGLAALGIDVPIARQIVGFALLTFLPGLLILRIHKISPSETLAHSVGLSIFFVMFLGHFMNVLDPLFSVSRPISLYPAKDHSPLRRLRFSSVFSTPGLFAVVPPFLAALSALLVSYHQNSMLLLGLILPAGAVSVLGHLDKILERAQAITLVIVVLVLLIRARPCRGLSGTSGESSRSVEHEPCHLDTHDSFMGSIDPGSWSAELHTTNGLEEAA